jgi:hypothetical protein
MSDIFQEIGEDIRRERMEAMWKAYGPWVLAGLIVTVLATAGLQMWRTDRAARQVEATTHLAGIIASTKGQGAVDAEKAFTDFAGSTLSGQAMLAKFRAAGLAVQAGDIEQAATIYKSIADDRGNDRVYRDYATILAVQASVDSGDIDALRAQLAPYLKEESPWRFSAQELAALLALRQKDAMQAQALLNKLVADPAAPDKLKGRAEEMLRLLTTSGHDQ